MQKLLTIAESCFADVNLNINLSKCAAMRIGNNCKSDCCDLKLSNGLISWRHELKYLGVVFGHASYLKVNLHHNKVKFFRAFNGIYAKIGGSNSVDTIVYLMKSKCLSVLLFNLEAVDISKTDLNNLKFPVFRSFMKIFNVKSKENVDWCRYYMNMLSVEYLVDAKKFKFYNKLATSECFLLRHLYSHAALDHCNAIRRKFGITNDNMTYNNFVFILWQKTHNDLLY